MDFYPEMDWHRLVRFLAGEYSPDQEKKTQSWILEDEGRAKRMDDLKRIWDASETSTPSRDVEAAWDELQGQLEAETEQSGSESGRREASSDYAASPSRHRPAKPRDRSRFRRIAVLGAVTFLAVFSLTLWYTDSPTLFGEETGSRTFSTEAGQRATVRLSDGSVARLNVDSRVELKSGFGEQNRQVSLEGEAYFEVTDENAHPFIVQVDGVRTEVLGTSFSVRAYPGGNGRRVAVSEGRVTVHPQQSEDQDTVHLAANNLGVFTGGHIQVVRRNADVEKAVAWTKGELVFDDTSFDRVVRELQRWYDAPVQTEVEASRVDHLNATFEEESLHQALEAIAAALNLEYRRDGRTVVFYRGD